MAPGRHGTAEGRGPSPGAEARIAGAGPLVSLLPAVLLGLLAVFNALPAAPPDGGRPLRAAMRRRTGDRLRATAVATAVGRTLGWVRVALGLYLATRGVALSGLWPVVIGWFLVAVATAEGGQAQPAEPLTGVTVGDVMGRSPLTVPAALAVGAVLASPGFRFRHAAFPVVDADGHPVGLVSVNAAARVPADRRDTPVASVMVPIEEIPTPNPHDPLVDVVRDLEESPARRAVVVADGTAVGVVTSSGISRVTSWLASSAWRERDS